jgi:uncharacterized protein YodC (DUF2158 family)
MTSVDEQKFKTGDVVRLKSGGPSMTIADYGSYGYGEEKQYMCKWFDSKHALTQQLFSEPELELVAPRR